jgi:hypothetical protein
MNCNRQRERWIQAVDHLTRNQDRRTTFFIRFMDDVDRA